MRDDFQMAIYDAELMYQRYCAHADRHFEIQKEGMLKLVNPLTKNLVESHIRVLEEIVAVSKDWASVQTDQIQAKIRELSKAGGDHED